MYEYFRLPVVPLYGGFPVKYRTYIGDPIPYDPNLNAAELAEKVRVVFCLFVCLLYQNSQCLNIVEVYFSRW